MSVRTLCAACRLLCPPLASSPVSPPAPPRPWPRLAPACPPIITCVVLWQEPVPLGWCLVLQQTGWDKVMDTGQHSRHFTGTRFTFDLSEGLHIKMGNQLDTSWSRLRHT